MTTLLTILIGFLIISIFLVVYFAVSDYKRFKELHDLKVRVYDSGMNVNITNRSKTKDITLKGSNNGVNIISDEEYVTIYTGFNTLKLTHKEFLESVIKISKEKVE